MGMAILTFSVAFSAFLMSVYTLNKTTNEISMLRHRAEVLEIKSDKAGVCGKIDEYYLRCLHDWCEEYTKEAVENAMKSPIELTHEEIEKAFGHRVRIVSEKKG